LILFEEDPIMPTLQVKYMLCKTFSVWFLLGKDSFR